jgi:hypothetical protein
MAKTARKMAAVAAGSVMMLGALSTAAQAYPCVDRDKPACAAPACCKLA